MQPGEPEAGEAQVDQSVRTHIWDTCQVYVDANVCMLRRGPGGGPYQAVNNWQNE